jgi:chromate transporter
MQPRSNPDTPKDGTAVPVARIFAEFLRLGLTSFGGPVAHIGYFRAVFVGRLRWIDEADFADLLALCQFLPGPASSQLGMAIGLEKAGPAGALAAFAGFTLPSAILMAAFGLGYARLAGGVPPGVLAGLSIVAVAVVADAVRSMAKTLASGRVTGAIALGAAAFCLALPGSPAQIAALLAGGLVGLATGRSDPIPEAPSALPERGSRRAAVLPLTLFALLLVSLPIAAAQWPSPTLAFLSALYRSGALVFGGGHVVLPLLESAAVAPGFVPETAFLAGYGLAQAMPGPLFSVSAYLGAVAGLPGPLSGAGLATLALFAPGFLLIVGTMPFWRIVRRETWTRRALTGVNAAVVGILGAALYQPIFTTAIHGPRDLVLALIAFAMLTVGRVPAWAVVVLAGLAGWMFRLG